MAMATSSRYTGPLDVNSMIEWMEDLLRPDALKPVSKELVVCPAFELYEEPRLATEFLTAHNIFRCTAGLAMLEWDLHAFQTARKYAEKALRKLQRIACLTVTQQSGRISEDRSTEKMWQWATVFGLGKLSPVGMMKFATPRVGNSDPTALAWDTTHNWFGERH